MGRQGGNKQALGALLATIALTARGRSALRERPMAVPELDVAGKGQRGRFHGDGLDETRKEKAEARRRRRAQRGW